MEKQKKRETKGHKPEETGQGRIVRGPITAEERAELMKAKPRWSCRDCVFCVSSQGLLMRTFLSGFPIAGMCANHPDTPGQLRPVPGTPCRNFRGKPRPDGVVPPIPPNGKVAYIPLTRGLHALVDAEDYEWLNQYQWYAAISNRGIFYARRNSPDGVVSMHRLIMQAPEGMVVDHINGNGLDNRRCNLRICTQYENALNSRPRADAKSRFKGVYPHHNKWKARVGGRYLGLFDDEVEAAKARDRKARELYGEHAWLNFPPESEGQ